MKKASSLFTLQTFNEPCVTTLPSTMTIPGQFTPSYSITARITTIKQSRMCQLLLDLSANRLVLRTVAL
jgi:hypothetical protein